MLGALVNVAPKSFQCAFETLVFCKRHAMDLTKAQYITLISTYLACHGRRIAKTDYRFFFLKTLGDFGIFLFIF